MSIGTPNGILDITGATLRVSKMEFRQSTGFDTVLNNVARNTMLLMDETEQTTSNSWALKLPNAWVAEFHGYWASGSSGAPILFNFYNDSTSGMNGYTLSMNDTTISINYDGGSALGSATLSSTLNTGAYRKVAVIFERSVLDVSVDGEHVFHFADSQLRDRVYDNNSGYVTFTHSSTDERKLKNLKFTNGDKWVREIDSSNIAYVGGNVGIGTTIPGTKLDVSGTVRGTHLIGDGSAISAIQSSNVSDFGSNVTRIGTLETDLGDNSSRITNLSSNLSDNSSRITTLESGDISISGDKTFTGDIVFESNVHMNGGNVFVANTVNMTVSDPIIELGSNNIGTNDLGIIMSRPAANSNVAVVFDESDDILRMGYTLNGASDSIVDLDSNALAVSVQGALSAANITTDDYLIHNGDTDTKVGFPSADTFTVTTASSERLRVDSSGNVGIGTTSPQEKFHLYGSPIIQHETRYDVGANDGWYKIGTWDAASATGARLKISLLGAKSYSALESARGGETIIYASINNNIPTTDCNMSGSIHAYGNPIITQAKFKQVGTDRTQYEIIAYVEPYTQHTMKIECSETTTFTRAWTSASDPGADSATVQAAKFTHVVDNAGNVGIGTLTPQSALHVAGDSGPSNTSLDVGVHMGVYSTNYPHIEIVAGGSNTGWIDFKNGNTTGNGDHTDRIRGGSGHLEFITNQTERMRIDSSGNVGIGTTTAGIILDVGSSLTNPQIGRDYAVGSVHDADKRDAIYFGRWDATDREFLGMKCRVDTHTNLGYGDYSNQTKIEFYTWGNNYAASREVMCIRGDGRVGIGTTNPEAQLHIGPKDNNHIYLASVNNDYGWKIDTDDQNNGIVPFRIIKRTNDVDSTVVTIKNQDGKVGIWTTDPTEVLHVNARSSSESAFIRIQSGSGGTNPATESGIKMTESGQYGFQFVHSAATDLLKVKHQDSNGNVNQDNIMVWHPNGDVHLGKASKKNFHYNPNVWSYSTNLYNTTTNFWSVSYYFDHEGYIFVTTYGHWSRKDASNANHAGGNQAFYGWVSVDNKEVTDSSLYDNFSGGTSSFNKFHEYWSPDNEGAGAWRDFSHSAVYKISAGWHSLSLRVTQYFSNSHYLNINGSGLIGWYIPKHYL